LKASPWTAFSVIGVSIQPGTIALTRILWRASPTERARITESIAPLLAA
jgi:hypothetical protein